MKPRKKKTILTSILYVDANDDGYENHVVLFCFATFSNSFYTFFVCVLCPMPYWCTCTTQYQSISF